MTPLLDTLLSIAEAAGQVIRKVYEAPFAVEWKGPRDPVTAADTRANDLICRRLTEAFPGVPIVAEESNPESFEGYRTAERVFFVDPLDGTTEFVAKNGEFVVMIGLLEGTRATAGVVLAPAQGVAWAGAVGAGAFRVAESGQREPIQVSTQRVLRDCRAVSSRSHRNPALEEAFAALGAGTVIALGSAGLKGTAVAAGNADVYMGPGMIGKRWDVCATDALVTAAGGKFSDGCGDLFDYRTENLTNQRGLVATNGLLHDEVLARLRPFTTSASRERA
jgi:3'(2'), 5'-bisphosphate nucleotidase